nr:hypothetical protein [uncultured Methanosphaera sp.]
MVVNDPFVSDPNKLLCVDDEVNMLNITRKRKTTHPVYPNYDFLQVEEINQVIYNMTHHGFVSVASIDTSAIFKKFWSDDKYYAKNSYCTFKDVNYNFTNVSFTNKESGTIWRFEVRNKLWNGTWRIDTNENVKYKVVTPNEHNGNILEIQSTRGKFENNKWQYDKLLNFTLLLYLDCESSRVITYSDVEIDGLDTEYVHPYYNTMTDKIMLYYKQYDKKKPREVASGYNLTLKHNIIYDNEKSEVISCECKEQKTPGEYLLEFPKLLKATSYTAELEVADPDYNVIFTKKLKVTTNADFTLNIQLLDKPEMFKGEVKEFKARLLKNNKYAYSVKLDKEKPLTIDIYHKYNELNTNPLSSAVKYQEKVDIISVQPDDKGYFTFKVNNRCNYDDVTSLTFNVSNYGTVTNGEVIFTPVTVQLKHNIFYAETWDALKNECEREDGADFIGLRNKNYPNVPKYVPLDSESNNIDILYDNYQQPIEPDGLVIESDLSNELSTSLSDDDAEISTLPSTENGVDTLPSDETVININRDSSSIQYIVGEKGHHWASLINFTFTSIFNVHTHKDSDNGVINKLVLKGIKLENSNCAIIQGDKTLVDIASCAFVDNINYENNLGSCILQNGESCISDIHHTYFINNEPCLVYGTGIVKLNKNVFRNNTRELFKNPVPFLVYVNSGHCSMFNNIVYLNFNEKLPVSVDEITLTYYSKLYANYLFHVEPKAKHNGKLGNQLKSNNSLNWSKSPYNNKSYIHFISKIDDNLYDYYCDKYNVNNGVGHTVGDSTLIYSDGYKIAKVLSEHNVAKDPFVKSDIVSTRYDVSIRLPNTGGVL